jgi:hypothetical protein
MEKIDRLGWAAGISFTSYGVRIGVRANSPEALDLVQEYFPPGWKPSPASIVERLYSFVAGNNGETQSRGVRRFNLLYRDIGRLARTRNLEEALELFESDMQLHVATEAPRRIFVHAGVVGWKGQAILVPGRSYSGKTTLVAELLKAGATYYSDEYAVLDARGRVHPYPRSLQIREGETGKQTRYPVETLGGRAGVKPLPVKLVIVSQYKPGAKWRPRELSAGQGVLELLNHTVSARQQPEKAFAALQQVALQALILKSGRGEAKDTVPRLFKYLDD